MLTKGSVQMYTIPTCSDCNNAKRYFKDHQVPYTEYNCEEDASYGEEVRKLTGKQIVPTIVMDGKVFIGFADNFTEINKALRG